MKFTAALSGANEVPSVATAGKGMFTATYNKDTSLLLWNMSYDGLSGPATAGHIHGPAAEGQNAGVMAGFNNPITSPMSGRVTLTPAQFADQKRHVPGIDHGQVTLTPAQFADLTAGKLYVNVHTAANKVGEIRGQLKAQ